MSITVKEKETTNKIDGIKIITPARTNPLCLQKKNKIKTL